MINLPHTYTTDYVLKVLAQEESVSLDMEYTFSLSMFIPEEEKHKSRTRTTQNV